MFVILAHSSPALTLLLHILSTDRYPPVQFSASGGSVYLATTRTRSRFQSRARRGDHGDPPPSFRPSSCSACYITKMSPPTLTTQLEIPHPPLPTATAGFLSPSRDHSPSGASGSRTPRPKTLTPSPPRSRDHSMTRAMELADEPDSMVLLRTIDFAARVRLFYPLSSFPSSADPAETLLSTT